MRSPAPDAILIGEDPMRRLSRHIALGAFQLLVFTLAAVALAVLLLRLR
jgi:hypothetical protein